MIDTVSDLCEYDGDKPLKEVKLEYISHWNLELFLSK